MKKFLCLIVGLFVSLSVFADNAALQNSVKKLEEKSDIQNINDYFEYLPNAVHNNWIPYKANRDYEIAVQFRIHKNGKVSEPKIVSSTYERANDSVLNAVMNGSPYKHLPKTYKADSVKAQVVLKYMR